MNSTLDYYNMNAKEFVKETVNIDFSETQKRFLDKLDNGDLILDFGCGSGRDTKYFLSKGLNVEAIDGSKEICKLASEYTGIKVRQMRFQDLEEVNRYNGIWACASILHLCKEELLSVINKMLIALKDNGVIYISFKNSEFEGLRNGRYFIDFTVEKFNEFVKDIDHVYIEDTWITLDLRPGKENEKWLNLILRKTSINNI